MKWSDALVLLVALEWRLASVTLLSACFAAAFGLHAVWNAIDSSGRSLIMNPKYREMLETLKVRQDKFEPLVQTELVFRWAITMWILTGLDTLVAMVVVPLDVKGATAPTWNLVPHLVLLVGAFALSAHAWFTRMRLDRQAHTILRMLDSQSSAPAGGNARSAG